MDLIYPDNEPDNTPEQTKNENDSKGDVQWDNLPFEQLLRIVGNNLNDSDFGNFAETFNSWIISYMKKNYLDDEEEEFDDDRLAELINKIIDTDTNMFENLKKTIEKIFEKNHQFEIPQ